MLQLQKKMLHPSEKCTNQPDCHLGYFGRPRREATPVWGMESLFIQCKDQHRFICSIFKTQGKYF